MALTRAGLWWERLARGFWPAATLAGLGLAALALGLVAALPAALLPWAGGGWALLVVLALGAGWRGFRAPTPAEAAERVDRRLAGRPLAALGDRMALGGPAADGLWRAHLAQARRAAAAARMVPPDAGLARRDPYALRLAAMTALGMALLFGGAGPAGQGLAALASGWRPARGAPELPLPAGPAWEGWAEPPAHTRRPAIYLNALDADALTLPQGTAITLRLYGEGLQVVQDIGPLADAAADPALAGVVRFSALRDGTIEVGGRRLAVTVIPDAPPAIQLAALATRRADGRLVQGFSAQDDNAIARGSARIVLDLAAVDRRFGLAVPPEPREPLVLDLPLPGAGSRQRVEGLLNADLARHPWANLPVRATFAVEDGIGQTGQTPPTALVLPGRRFFDPLAAALIELRRDLLWSRQNAGRTARLLRAVQWQPARPVPPAAARAVAGAVSTLEGPPLTPEARDALAASLWDAAVLIEDGGLSDALARMRQAQERLSEAIRGGASPDEVRKLMDDLKAATDAYTRMLAQRGEDPAARFDRAPQQGRQISGDQIRQMMDEIERLMNEGRMAEAGALLDQFNRMMENLQVREGRADGQGTDGRGGPAQRRLGQTLRDQQKLADDALRQAQRDPFGSQQGGDQQGGDQQDGDRQSGPQADSSPLGDASGQAGALADRQRALRQDLGRQGGLIPGRGTPQGDEAQRQIGRAGRAMDRAEEALRQGDAAAALDQQAQAIEAMREGMRALADLNAGQQGQQGQPGRQGRGQNGESGDQGRAQGQGEGPSSLPGRDPLGRSTAGQGGNIVTGEPFADLPRQEGRARALQDEIRRRAGEPQRPQGERDYLGRLLDPF